MTTNRVTKGVIFSMRDAIYLSAMLHDIGEFVSMANPNKDLPTHNISSYNIAKELDITKNLLPDIEKLIANHHNPTTVYERIIASADVLSCKEEKYEEALDTKINPQPLKPIFMKIKEKENGIDKDYVYEINSLDLKKIFPKVTENSMDISNDYQKLYVNFMEELKNVKDQTQLLYLLEKYLWCIPTHDIDKNYDVSIYEHAKNTAAIALCLYEQYIDGELTDQILNNIEESEIEQFLLIHGDLSGIQDFIMNISSKGAAKSLKSHSVYLTILTDVVVRYILDSLDLKDGNLLYSGGGSFFILAPKSYAKKMDEIKKEVMIKVLKAHGGELFYGIDYIYLSPKDFVDFPNQWQKAVEKVNKQKYLKWQEIVLKDNFELIFGPLDEGTEEGEHCNVCGTSYSNRNKSKITYEDEELNICSLCYSFIELTEKLRDAKYFYINKGEAIDIDNPKNYKEIFRSFGYDVDFKKSKTSNKGRYYLLNNTNFLSEECSGFRFGAYSLPKGEKGWATFQELAEQSKGDKNLLGVLKLDVDNLGSIFGFGLAESKTVSRITTLSRMISLYFEGYINQIIKDLNMEKSIYTVYSGGDDTFLIGSWNKVLEFAKRFREKFSEYVCYNEKITFSAAIGIFNCRYPVIRSIDLTESSLDNAKNYLYSGETQPTKNKVSLLGEVFNWEEFRRIERVKQLLIDTINKANEYNEPNIGRGLLYKIAKSTAGFKIILQDSNKGKVDSVRFWRLAYYLREVKEMDKKRKYGREFAEEIIEEYRQIVVHNLTGQNKDNNIRNIMIIPVATRLAEMETKV